MIMNFVKYVVVLVGLFMVTAINSALDIEMTSSKYAGVRGRFLSSSYYQGTKMQKTFSQMLGYIGVAILDVEFTSKKKSAQKNVVHYDSGELEKLTNDGYVFPFHPDGLKAGAQVHLCRVRNALTEDVTVKVKFSVDGDVISCECLSDNCEQVGFEYPPKKGEDDLAEFSFEPKKAKRSPSIGDRIGNIVRRDSSSAQLSALGADDRSRSQEQIRSPSEKGSPKKNKGK